MTANELAIEVGDAMADYLAARNARDKARDRTESDWGYYGHPYEEEVKTRAAFLGQALDAFTNR